MGFWVGVMQAQQDLDARREREKDREERAASEAKADKRYESEREYRAGRDLISDTNRAEEVRRQKDKDMAAAGFVYSEEKGGYVHQSQMAAAGYSSTGSKLTPAETRDAAAAKVGLNREVKEYYAPEQQGVTMAPGTRTMTGNDKNFFETLEGDPRTQAGVFKWYQANKDKYGLTVDMLPTLYTLDVTTPEGQEAAAAVVGVDDPTGLSKAIAIGQSVVPKGTFAVLDESQLPLSVAEEDKQYTYTKERVVGDLARLQIKRAEQGLSTSGIQQVMRRLEDAGTEAAGLEEALGLLGGPDYLVTLEDTGDERWQGITKNTWFTPILTGGVSTATAGLDKENVKPGDIVTGSDGNSYLATEGPSGIKFEPTTGESLLPPTGSRTTEPEGPAGTLPGAQTQTGAQDDRRLTVDEAARVARIETDLSPEDEGSSVKSSSGAEYVVTVADGKPRLEPARKEVVSTGVTETEKSLTEADIGSEVTTPDGHFTVIRSADTGRPILVPFKEAEGGPSVGGGTASEWADYERRRTEETPVSTDTYREFQTPSGETTEAPAGLDMESTRSPSGPGIETPTGEQQVDGGEASVLSNVTAEHEEAKGAPLEPEEELAVGIEALVTGFIGQEDPAYLDSLTKELYIKHGEDTVRAALDLAMNTEADESQAPSEPTPAARGDDIGVLTRVLQDVGNDEAALEDVKKAWETKYGVGSFDQAYTEATAG